MPNTGSHLSSLLTPSSLGNLALPSKSFPVHSQLNSRSLCFSAMEQHSKALSPAPFIPLCPTELPEHRETFQAGMVKASPPVSQAQGPDPVVAIPLHQEYSIPSWGLSMLHNQHCKLEHGGLKCPGWLQESKHIAQAPECGFGMQSSIAALDQTSQTATSIPEMYSNFPGNC